MTVDGLELVVFVCVIAVLVFVFQGDPDIHDAVIHYLMGSCPGE